MRTRREPDRRQRRDRVNEAGRCREPSERALADRGRRGAARRRGARRCARRSSSHRAALPRRAQPAAAPGPPTAQPARRPAQPPPTGGGAVRRQRQQAVQRSRLHPAQIDAQLKALHDSGATIARTDAFWEGAEPAAPVNGVHHYDWRFDDTIAAALASHRLKWLPIIDYTAYWAESVPGKDHSPPTLSRRLRRVRGGVCGALRAATGSSGASTRASRRAGRRRMRSGTSPTAARSGSRTRTRGSTPTSTSALGTRSPRCSRPRG